MTFNKADRSVARPPSAKGAATNSGTDTSRLSSDTSESVYDGSEIDSLHGTLSAATIRSVTVTGATKFRVQNRSTTDTISYKFSTLGTSATPSSLGSDTLTLRPGTTDEWPLTEQSTVNVILISTGTPAYSVEAW